MGQIKKIARAAHHFLMAGSLLAATPAQSHETQDNTAILLQTQNKYQTLMVDAQDDYSADLNELEISLNAQMKKMRGPYSHIAVLDPVKLDIAKGIGIPDTMAVQTMLLQKKIFPYPALLSLTQNFMVTTSPTVSGENSYTQNPHALYLMNQDAKVEGPCLIIPMPSNTIPDALKIPGMNIRDNARFSNLHEGWHCLDTTYYTKHFAPEIYQSFDPKDLTTLLSNGPGREAYINQHKLEAFADVATIGTLIRAKTYDLTLADTIAAWRENKFEDLIHYTSPVLKGFKEKIEKIGIDGFRALTDDKAREFYYATVETYALTPRGLEIKIRRDNNDISVKVDKDDPDAKRAATYTHVAQPVDVNELASAFTAILDGKGKDTAELMHAKKINDTLANWKPFEELTEKARKSGNLTPESITHAYVVSMNELYRLSITDTANADLYEEKATRLKKSYIEETSGFDYTTVQPVPAL